MTLRGCRKLGVIAVSNSQFEYPDGLQAKGRRLWDLYASHFDGSLPELDTVHLEVACNLLDLIDQLREHLVDKPNDSAGVTRYAIALDKFEAMSRSLGLTLAHRVNSKLQEAPAAVARRKELEDQKKRDAGQPKTGRPKKTQLGTLTPEQLGIRV